MDVTSVQTAYGRYAKLYDATFGAVSDVARRAAVERMNRTGGQRILEVGIGTGLTIPLHHAGNRVDGIDVCREMLDIAQARAAACGAAHRVALHEMDAADLAFADDSFDVVAAMFVMSVVHDAPAVLRELQRVCKPSGRILIINHFAAEDGPMLWAKRGLAPLCRKLGWHSDFRMADLLAGSDVSVAAAERLPPFGLFTLLECRKAERLALAA